MPNSAATTLSIVLPVAGNAPPKRSRGGRREDVEGRDVRERTPA